MPTPWKKKTKDSGQLLYFNAGAAWSANIDKAATSFYNLGCSVKFIAPTEKKNANVVIKLSMGADSETFDGSTLSTSTGFDPARLHGSTKTLTEVNDLAKTAE